MSRVRSAFGRTFGSLREPNLRWYFSAELISISGTWVQTVALPWLVLELTKSGTALGITAAAQTVPVLVLGAYAGLIADRFDRRKILVVTSSLLGLLAGLVGALTFLGLATFPVIVVIAALTGLVTALDNPAMRALMPQLIDEDQIPNAVSIHNAVFTSARIIGPVIAGFCIATFGLGWCFVINAISYGVVVLAMFALDRSKIHIPPAVARARGQVREGLAHLWHDHLLRLAFVMIVVLGALAFNYQVTLPLIAKRTFGAPAGAYAVMFAVVSIGSLAGALSSAHRATSSGRTMLWGAVGMGVTMALAALAPSLTLEYVALVPMGFAGMVFLSAAISISNERTSPEFRGRVNALFTVAYMGSTPIGAPLVGAVAQHFGARSGLLLGAVASLATGVVGIALLSRWLHARSASPPATAGS